MATSALAALALWIFFAFFMPLVAGLLAGAIAPMPPSGSNDVAAIIRNEETRQTISAVSPITLYSEATSVVLDPLRKTTRSLILMGPMERLSISRFQSPLPLAQSTLIVAPYLVLLVALTVICFGICYACFMRQEVRST
jgi:ABC-2 type transport system permease protein